MLIFGEWHLRRVLASYTAYYNQARTLGITERCASKEEIEAAIAKVGCNAETLKKELQVDG